MSILAIHGDLYGILCQCFRVIAEHKPLSHDAVTQFRRKLVELQAPPWLAKKIITAHRTSGAYVTACLTPGVMAYHLNGSPAYPLSSDEKQRVLARYREEQAARQAAVAAARVKAERKRQAEALAAAKQQRRENRQRWISLTPPERAAKQAADAERKAANRAVDQARQARNQQERERVVAAMERLKAQGKLYRHGAAMLDGERNG